MKITKQAKREKRKLHIKKRLIGTSVRPRIFVFKSNQFFYSGIADDEKSVVLMSKMAKKRKEDILKMAKVFVTEMKKKKIDNVVFDRSGYRYHGLIAAFADELRKNDIKI
ncbi:MAG: 50S ribosomal protein L18, large subunit ribosomal protein L18 [candidate division WS6 bacterium GW2011_GWC1_33_20]|uniref:Large ribosomal subunit protein uL18 n=2 Tax=Candidatus Dojkabacteria TaxID=74243 RepID=A0A0G0ADH9_9BACT|nr:ribosomal protein L18 [uncultured bacterium]KKP42863.1 MAG: 50S ribosomal protein L18, large subunit ribosomal protein L18 [candidate division WS6 bacterium GW2011_GWE2_33_157]KKP44551.1 MAG: 50S ribosomal protein L18, large subunit ribosomal protein L18 [candidate division WS6 bacterium GW2011_GWC1_33_20]KKP46139.1 MAG: 50S ribosomal protein L18, large subunit ribosomal protein L18 [candidate division WS6 bacterium GW2011_GWF1_33_233]KKP54648.1 MAG: 50S ribosomal protein L18 [candidate divi